MADVSTDNTNDNVCPHSHIVDPLRGIVLLELYSEFCPEKMPLEKKLNFVPIKDQDPRLLADIE
jgi:hypothetical protein